MSLRSARSGRTGRIFHGRRFDCGLGLLLAVAVLVPVAIVLRLWRYDLRVPLSYRGDTLFILTYVKGLLQDGWPFSIRNLSAPFTYPGASFPAVTSTDWLIMKAIGLFTAEPGLVMNSFWLLTLVLGAWSAAYASYQLGLSKALAFVSGCLYAWLPFAFLRNVSHLTLAYYLVPGLCLVPVVIMGEGKGVRNARGAMKFGLCCALLQGFDYIYYSFFAGVLFSSAALISWARTRRLSSLKFPLVAIGVISLATAANLAPTFYLWHAQGRPPILDYKHSTEAEVYAAKFHRLIAPHLANPLRPLAVYAEREKAAIFPNENENVTARLGLYGALGLVLALGSLLLRRDGKDADSTEPEVARLILLIFLFITVGGLGAVFNFLVVPDIRAYNRFSVFLAFYCMVVTGLWLQRKAARVSSPARYFLYFAAAGFALLSMDDQLLDALPLKAGEAENIRRAASDRALVENLEKQLPAGSAVLQLPFIRYPVQVPALGKMEDYDHARGYIWSQRLRWSWPSFSEEHSAWQSQIRGLQGADFVRAAALSGFSAIWINREGYDDNGRAIISSLEGGGASVLPAPPAGEKISAQITILDLRPAKANLLRTARRGIVEAESASLFNGAVFGWPAGFYGEEMNGAGRYFHWALANDAVLTVKNPRKVPLRTEVSFVVGGTAGNVEISSAHYRRQFPILSTGQRVQIPLAVEPHQTQTIRFSANAVPLKPEGDARSLYFFVIDPHCGPSSLPRE
jgi:hypothetical protein